MSLRRLYEDFNINKTAGNLSVDVMGENKEKDFEIVKEILGDDYDFFDQDFEVEEMPTADLEVDDIIEIDSDAGDTNQEDADFIAVNDDADKAIDDLDFEEIDDEDQDVDAEDDTKNASDTDKDAEADVEEIEIEDESAVEEDEVPDEVEDLVAEIEETPADEDPKVMMDGELVDDSEVDESLEEDYDDFDNDLFDADSVQDAADETDYDDYEDFADFNGMWVEKEEPMDWPDPFEAEEKYTDNASKADEEFPVDEDYKETCEDGECEEELTEAKDKEYKAFTVQEIKDRLSRFIESKEEPEKLDGMDNAVVDCQTDFKVIAHSEDEKPLDCNMKKDPLPKALTEDAEEDDMSDEEFLEAVGRDVISKKAAK